MVEAQAHAILSALGTWLAAAPGRRLTLSHDAEGYEAVLSESAACRGVDATDALAQVTTVVKLGGAHG